MRIIEEIVEWRKFMWKPQPFIWEHKNYLIKIINDSLIFTSKGAKMFFNRNLLKFSDKRLLIPKEGCYHLLVSEEIKQRLLNAAKVLDCEKEIQSKLTEDIIRSKKFIPVLRWKPKKEYK